MRAGTRSTRAFALLAGLTFGTLPAQMARAEDWPHLGLSATRARTSSERSGVRFDAGTWQHRWTEDQGVHRALLATPAVGDGAIALATQRSLIRVLEERDGSVRWTARAGGVAVSSPAIARGLVFVVGANQKLTALHLGDGSVAWERDVGAMGYASPVVVDGKLFVATGSPTPRVWSLEAATGVVRWQAGSDLFNASVLTSLAVADGHVIAGELEGRYYSFDAADGKVRWAANIGGHVALSSPLIAGGKVYLAPGGSKAEVFALDLATGQAVEGWPLALPVPAVETTLGEARGRTFITSSLAGSDLLLLALRTEDRFGATSTGEAAQYLAQEQLIAVDPAKREVSFTLANGRLESANPNDLPTHELMSTPALYRGANDELLIAAASSLNARVRIVNAMGQERGSVTLDGATRASPALANGRLIVAGDTGVVASFLSAANRPPMPPQRGFAPAGDSHATRTTLRWGGAVDPDGDAVTYVVRADDDGEVLEDWAFELTTTAGVQSVALPALVPGRQYTFAVRTRDTAGALSPWSQRQQFTASDVSVVVNEQPYATVEEAIADTPSGGTVVLGGGRIVLGGTLNLPAGVRLSGAGPHLTTLDARGLKVGVTPGRAASLVGFSLTGAEIGVAVDAPEVTLRNVILRDHAVVALDVAQGGGATVINASIVRNGTGVRAAGATNVRNSLVVGNEVGLHAVAEASLHSRYNDVHGNAITNYRNLPRPETDLDAGVSYASVDPNDLRLDTAQPTTDKGDPTDDFSREPTPNGDRINIGAYGGTEFAELSPDPSSVPPDAGGAGTGGVSGAGGSSGADGAGVTTSNTGGTTTTPHPPGQSGGCAIPPTSVPPTLWPWLLIALAFIARHHRK